MKLLRTVIIGLICVMMLSLPFAGTAAAANIPVTGGTNGPACNSGGYFTPSSTSISSGDTITFSVPSNDPYAGGIEVHGFPQGSFVVARGASVTTNPITTDISYYGTWPSTGCMKGSGTITVQITPSPTPSTSPSPSPSASPSSTPQASPSPSVSTAAAPKQTGNPTPAHTATIAPQPSPTVSTTVQPTPTSAQGTAQTQPATKATPDTVKTNQQPSAHLSAKMAAAVTGGSLLIATIGILTLWKLVVQQRMKPKSYDRTSDSKDIAGQDKT